MLPASPGAHKMPLQHPHYNPTAPTAQRVYNAMVAYATRRDRLCFASHTTLAREARCSRRSVIRAQQDLIAQGVIERRDHTLPSGQRWRTCVWGFPKGQRRLPRPRFTAPGVAATSTQSEASGEGNEPDMGAVSISVSHNCSSSRRSYKQKTTGLTPRHAPARVIPLTTRGRRRKIVEQAALFPTSTQSVVRKNGSVTAFNAGDVLAAIITAYGLPIPRRFKARVARAAKLLLEDGFDPPTVCAVCLMSLQRGRCGPEVMEGMAMDFQNARHGNYWTQRDYEAAVKRHSEENDPMMQRLYQALGLNA